MARCTAPVHGHRTASGRADCPACGSRYGSRSFGAYPSSSYSNSYSTPRVSSASSSGGAQSRSKPKWSPAGSSVYYSDAEVKALTPIRQSVEARVVQNDPRDVFLCHAWDDRGSAAKELSDQLVAQGVSVWFSEKDILLGSPLLREIDKGLARSRVGIVLVTPAFLKRIEDAGIADKELSVLLARDLLVPIVHGTTYEALREVSPMLASRTGLNTSDNTMAAIAAKLAELVAVEA